MQENQLYLSDRDKPQFFLFNQVYLCILARYQEAVRSNVFRQLANMERLSANFASLYFDVVTDQSTNTIIAWDILQKNRPLSLQPVKALALGANAHINHDLPLALLQSKMTQDDFIDYRAFGVVVKGASADTVNLLQDRLIGGRFAPIRKIYAFAVYCLIEYWRRRVWKNFKKLKQCRLSPEKLNQVAGNYAYWIKANIFLGLIRSLF